MRIIQHFKYLLILLTASYFIFAGTGYNVAKYCCTGCENKGIEHIAEEKIAHNITHSHSNCCETECPTENQDKAADSCELLRLSLDQFSVEESDLDFHTPESQVFTQFSGISDNSRIAFLKADNLQNPINEFHLFSDGNDINLLKCVFLI